MATFYYFTTHSRWEAAQARGYLLESSVESPGGLSNGKRNWTYLYLYRRVGNGQHAENFVWPTGERNEKDKPIFVRGSVVLAVSYEQDEDDLPVQHGCLAATRQIPLSDVEVIWYDEEEIFFS